MNSLLNDPNLAYQFSRFCAYIPVGFTAIGSMIGCCQAGAAALACWKRSYQENKPAPFALSIFAGAPFSQMIYAMILMIILLEKTTPESPALLPHFMMGVFGGLLLMASALAQGKIGVHACDMYGNTNKGFGNAITVVGVVETVGLFLMIFATMAV